jgi:hypothetical protein
MPTSDLAKSRKSVITMAIFYALLLFAGALLMVIPGDGSLFFAGLFSAPFSLLGWALCFFEIQPPGLLYPVGILVLWITAGTIGTISEKVKRRVCLSAFLIVHYVSALIVLQTEHFGNWARLQERLEFSAYAWIFMFFLTVYFLGQVWLWLQLLRTFSKSPVTSYRK